MVKILINKLELILKVSQIYCELLNLVKGSIQTLEFFSRKKSNISIINKYEGHAIVDLRKRRSQEKLQVALADHLQSQTIDEITIGQLTKTAGVSRQTFYSNFDSKQSIFCLLYTSPSPRD